MKVIMVIFKYNDPLPKLVLGLKTTYETHGQDKIASASIQTYDDMKTFESNVVNENQNKSCIRK